MYSTFIETMRVYGRYCITATKQETSSTLQCTTYMVEKKTEHSAIGR